MISVIVPVYKVEPYIRQCVESVLGQTYSNFELILVDDGSPDGCGAICDEYAEKDSRVRVVHQKNAGLSAARNAGLDIAKGEYVTFIDSDDYVNIHYLENLWQTMNEKDAEISVCQMRQFTDGKEFPVFSENVSGDNIVVYDGHEACAGIYRLDGSVSIVAWGKLYKSSLFEKLRFPVGMLHEDNAVTPIACYEAGKVAVSSNKLYYYRQRESSIMGEGFSAKRFEQITATELCIAHFKNRQDSAMIKAAQKYEDIIKSKLVIKAISNHAEGCIPEEYRISERKALKTIRQNSNDDLYCWYLSLVHPNWVRPHSYLRKIKQMLGIRGN